ncbi:hypothetical protein N8I77_000015 [Diaporthe amygdali]|uniref:Major facilitator superfamily (MFS) profile domain-containing protein n=1 Tax=Phomopsis amygdali TaxID=1214568 RepID=A0AAD9SMJ0_PHOAM|nr:hypothetical protein N8I77_000015 [Diaporthe amygdali]
MVNESPERCDSINNKSLTPANNSTVPIAQPKDAPAQDSEQHRDTKEAPGPSVDPGDSCQSQQHPTALDLLGLLVTWTPKNCRYDSNEPPKFSLSLNLLFALAGTITVANLYYVQPILYKIAVTFDVSFEKASSIATLQQAGYATGLLIICPLGDVFKRRLYILALVMFTAIMWLGLCLTPRFESFAAISFICGMTTVTPQLMLPLVGDLAPADRKASCLSIVVSGLSLGILVARLLSGIIANFTDWRNVYWFSFGAQWCIFILLFFYMPDYPSKNPGGLNWFELMWSILYMFFTEPLLVQVCIISFVMSSIFTSFWTTLSFLLSSPPFNYSSLVIGLFALIGIAIIFWGPVYSRLVIDKIQPLYSCLIGIGIELTGVAIGTFTGTFTVAGPIIEAIAIDLGNQACNIANRTAINDINPKARNRVNTCYMLAAFTGQLTGTAVGNRLYAIGGWKASGISNLAFLGFAVLVCFARGPRERRWIGWSGGWGLRRDKLEETIATRETRGGDSDEAGTS